MVVAIVDTGVDTGHPFFAGRIVEEACYSSNVAGRSLTVCPNGSTQQIGTGAGVTFPGVAKGTQIMAVQVFSKFTSSLDCGGSAPCVLAWTSDIIAGLERVYALRGVRSL